MNNANSAGSISEDLLRLLKQYEMSSVNSLQGPSMGGNGNYGERGHQLPGAGPTSFGGHRGQLPPAVQPGFSGIPPPLKPNPVKKPQPLLTVEKARDDLLLNVLTAAAASRANFGAAAAMPPIMLPRDHSAERSETLVEGQWISCFDVGGEKRLCLPQLLNAVLHKFSLPEINKACAELHVHCSQCSKEQLEVLKVYQVLPISAVSCGLITKSDAERLTSYLFQSRQTSSVRSSRHLAAGPGSVVGARDSKMSIVGAGAASTSGCSSSGTSNVSCSSSSSLSAASVSSPASACSDIDTTKDKANNDSDQFSSLPVYHECFGRCRGKFKRDLYQKPNSDCIECDECGLVFAPHRFVLHSHRNHETKTCHWGFDSENWRLYLHLAPEMENSKEAEKILDEEKAKFPSNAGQQQPLHQHQSNAAKRSLDSKHIAYPFAEKRPRLDTVNGLTGLALHPLPTVPDYLPAGLGATGQQMKPAVSATTAPAGGLPFFMCDPLAIYNAVLASRSFAPSLLPFLVPQTAPAGGLPFAPPKSADVGQSAVEDAADGLLKLAPANAAIVHSDSKQKIAPMVSIEPLKKHILHRTQLKLNTYVPAAVAAAAAAAAAATNGQVLDKIAGDKSAAPKSAGADDIGTIDLLLNHYVKDPEGLRMIRAKLDETRRHLDGKMDCLSSQNRILQQEIAYLRNKRTSSATSSSILTTVSP